MPAYDFLIDGMTFSYSNLSSFNNCKYGWYLNYIDAEESVQNFFAQYGLLIHETLEKYWKKELDKNKLLWYYETNYFKKVVEYPPIYPRNMGEAYYKSGAEFFENPIVDRNEYDIIFIEEKIISEHGGKSIVVKPDLLVRNIKTGNVVLMDYKTSKPIKGENFDMEKMDGYIKQLMLYKYFIEKERNLKIDRIEILFIRLRKIYTIEMTPKLMNDTIDWLDKTLVEISMEEDFIANPSNKYFCSNLCGVRNSCKFWR